MAQTHLPSSMFSEFDIFSHYVLKLCKLFWEDNLYAPVFLIDQFSVFDMQTKFTPIDVAWCMFNFLNGKIPIVT